ncbi:MAG: diguanylate cyclase [Dokdonella sp.]
MLARLSGGDPDLRFRAEVVLGIGALETLTVGLISVSELIWGTFVVGLACMVGMLAIIPILTSLVRSAQIARAATQFMCVLYLVSAALNIGSGGQTIGVSVALPSLVLIGAMVLSRRAAVLLFLAVVAQLILVSALEGKGLRFLINPDPQWAHRAIFRVPILISISTAFIGLLVRRAMQRHRSELARTQKDLADNEKQLREIIEYSRGLICTHSLEGDLISSNPAAAEALGYRVDELIGKNIRELVPEERIPFVAEYLARILANGVDSNSIFILARDGEPRIWEYNNRLCTDINGAPYVLVNATDMTERRQLEEKLREQNIRDPLTGCFNRRYLNLLESRYADAQRWACIVVDLDNFKQVNDTHGHRRGDEILVDVGKFLNAYTGQNDAVIRMGGDEFLLVMSEADPAKVEATAQRIRLAANREAPCELSIGCAARIESESLNETIDRADRQLYRSRSTERDESSTSEH